MKVVIVESPAKAQTINKYLGSDFSVIASMGHVRDLTAKNGSVDVNHDFNMLWETDARSEKTLKEICKLVKKADELILATDPDREGEAISWHVLQLLKERNVLKPNIPVQRVVFHEITKSAVQEAVKNPRAINQDLIDAYLARRALDYLVGFNLSPVLWRKLPGSKSAGRVQSVALRLVADREEEIEAFKTQEYWSIEALLSTEEGKRFSAKLTHLNGAKLDKFSINNATLAQEAVELIQQQKLFVASVEKKQTQRHPTAPFTTSTLQQEAARKLGFSTTRTMRTAQQLYEGITLDGGNHTGLITYMRTDSVTLSKDAIAELRNFIQTTYGDAYLPSAHTTYKSKTKNAQEAHEAIRPTEIGTHPDTVKQYLNADQFKLYQLIWKRTVSCQMSSALFDQVSVDMADKKNTVVLHTVGSTLVFDGFLKVYQEGQDDDGDANDSDGGKTLPLINEKSPVCTNEVTPQQHFTSPPPRYTEASMVKKMEEYGIGRPSTYSSILKTLQDRDYVVLESKRFFPKDRGRIVTAFLKNFFSKYVEYGFTSAMEENLDEIANGTHNWKDVLSEFWQSFQTAVESTQKLTIAEVIDKLNQDLAAMLFPQQSPDQDPHICASCGTGQLSLKLGKFGAFVGCSNYPTCQSTRKLGIASADDDEAPAAALNEFSTKELGVDPADGKIVTIRKGPYGFYFQWGEAEKKLKPKRVSLAKDVLPENATLEMALSMPVFPRELGKHPESGEDVSVNKGRFGPYVKYKDKYISIKGKDASQLTLEEAIAIVDSKFKPEASE